MTVYQVGAKQYREHPPHSLFEAELSPDTERRAFRFGAITLIERSTTTLQAGSFMLPDGWTAPKTPLAGLRP